MSTLGLVLAGGAARGAYEAGVLSFVFGDLAHRMGRIRWPDVVSGTSVGALNGSFAAARDPQRLVRLVRLWDELTIADVYQMPMENLWGALKASLSPTRKFSLLDPTPLYRLVHREFPARELRESIAAGACRAMIVSATELATGYNTLFVDSAHPAVTIDPPPGARVRRQWITERVALASAAIPFLFPPVLVGGAWHVDGGLRQNTPLGPVIRAGADRILVVGVKQTRAEEGEHPLPDVVPNLTFLAGKTLNALWLDPVERDIAQAELVNRIARWGEGRDPGFTAALAAELGLHAVELQFVRPSQDLGRVAAEQYRARPPDAPRPVRFLLSMVADRTNAAESDLLSYLYFDRSFTAEILRLGYADAKRQEEELARLFEA